MMTIIETILGNLVNILCLYKMSNTPSIILIDYIFRFVPNGGVEPKHIANEYLFTNTQYRQATNLLILKYIM